MLEGGSCLCTCSCSPRTLMFWRCLLSLSLLNPPPLVSDFPSEASSPLSALTELRSVQALLQVRRRLIGLLRLVWSSLQTAQTLWEPATRWLCFVRMNARVALFISFRNFPLHSQLGSPLGRRGLAFGPSWLLKPTFLTELSHAGFGFSVTDVHLFLSLEHSEAI